MIEYINIINVQHQNLIAECLLHLDPLDPDPYDHFKCIVYMIINTEVLLLKLVCYIQ
jgi:hypothetical protein